MLTLVCSHLIVGVKPVLYWLFAGKFKKFQKYDWRLLRKGNLATQ